MKGVILAGGVGSRLRPLTHTRPKQLVPIVNKPVLQYVIEDLRNAEIDEICIVLGVVGGEQIRNRFGDGSNLGVNITYAHQSEPLGPADAVAEAESFVGDESFVVYFGDTFVSSRITQELVSSFDETTDDAALAFQHVDEPSRYGVPKFNDDEPVRILEKPSDPPTNLAYVGVFVLSPVVFEVIRRQDKHKTGEVEITETLDRLVNHGYEVSWELIDGVWRDVGTPQDVVKTNELLLESLEKSHDGYISPNESIAGPVHLANGAKVESEAEVHGPALIGQNAEVESGTEIGPGVTLGPKVAVRDTKITSSVVMAEAKVIGANLSESLLGERVSIEYDEKLVVPESQLVVGDDSKLGSGTR